MSIIWPKRMFCPFRHLLVLRDNAKSGEVASASAKGLATKSVPAWVQDYALFLLDVGGTDCRMVCGSRAHLRLQERRSRRPTCFILLSGRRRTTNRLKEELKRTAVEGHAGTEGWHVKKDGSRFWANVITMALKDENGELQGFARVVRDFSDRHERDEKLRRSRGDAAVRSLRHRRSPASFPASLTEFLKPTMRSSNLSDTAARICRRAGCAGPI